MKEANAFVARHHRRHGPVIGAKLAVAAQLGGATVGVAIAGRPVARGLDDGRTLEVTRVATIGARNACSMLYGAVRRAACALGYVRLVTYTLATEDGASLRAAGWRMAAWVRGRSWSCASRLRAAHTPVADKLRWQIDL